VAKSSASVPAQSPPPPKTRRGEATRQKILVAAEREIGSKGFAEASIAAITQEAGVAQGTFYLYFHSKEDVLRELVLLMGRMLRRHLTVAAVGAEGRIEAERRGLAAFFAFVRARPYLYRVVAESQFVDAAIFKRYYLEFADGYARVLAAAAERGEISAGDAEVRAWALMGVADMVGRRFAVWGEAEDLAPVVEAALAFVVDGIGRHD
jgi:AcrR family transcriptional regulator